jgi:hypothetical protein
MCGGYSGPASDALVWYLAASRRIVVDRWGNGDHCNKPRKTPVTDTLEEALRRALQSLNSVQPSKGNEEVNPMAQLSREQMREYQRARRTRMKAEAEGKAPPPDWLPADHPLMAAEPIVDAASPRNAITSASAPSGHGATSAQVIAAGERAARLMAQPPKARTSVSPSHALVPYRPPMQGDIHKPLLVGQVGPGSLRAQGGRAADRSGFSSVATATAAIRAELAQENADLRRGMADLVRRDRDKEMRLQALEQAKAEQPAFVNRLSEGLLGILVTVTTVTR